MIYDEHGNRLVMDTYESADMVKNPSHYRKLIYLAHPYGGKPENVTRAAQLRARMQQSRPEVTIFSPVEHFSPLEGRAEEPEVLRHCLTVLRRCDALWAAPGHEGSKGCTMEIAYAHAHGIPVVYLEAADE